MLPVPPVALAVAAPVFVTFCAAIVPALQTLLPSRFVIFTVAFLSLLHARAIALADSLN
jgi:hypothetical protein